MDINLPLILFIAVSWTGVVWVTDLIFLAGKRRKAIKAVESQFDAMSEEEKEHDEKYKKAIESVSLEHPLIELSKSFFPVLLLVFVLRSFLIEPFQIPSESMVPTLEKGDFILVNKFTYGIRLPLIRTKVMDLNDPKRGDVMVFFPPHQDRYFIKRVIGLPHDTVMVKNGVLYINGEKMEQTFAYTDDREYTNCNKYNGNFAVSEENLGEKVHSMRRCKGPILSREGVWEVPEGHYFMMGDNRDNSSDSREWGPVSETRIVGKAFAIWMHWRGWLPSFSRAGGIN